MNNINIRSCFIASPGKVLICADYAGQELRVLAHVSKDPTMIKAFQENKDLHQAVADEFGVSRNEAKTVNFGIAYGKSYIGFAKDWNVPIAKAKQFINNYFKRFPAIKKAVDKCSKKTKEQKAIRNITGRIRRFEWVDDRALRQSFNFLIQSVSADMMKKAAGDVRQLCLQHPEWGCKLCLSVHDELVYEIKEEYVKEALPLIKETMEKAIELCIPVVVDIHFGRTYAEAKP